jgi:hypothetical protein
MGIKLPGIVPPIKVILRVRSVILWKLPFITDLGALEILCSHGIYDEDTD